MNPIAQFVNGLKSYWAGIAWLKAHPRYFFLLLVPAILGVIFVAIAYQVFISYADMIYAYILFDPGDSSWMVFLYNIARFFLGIAMLVLSLLVGFLVSNIVSAPFYDFVSVAIERDITGSTEEITLWQSLKLIPEEIKKVLAILAISFVMLLIPGLNLIAVFVTAFLIGWDFYDYPLSRRGWSFRKRFRFVASDFWSVMGLGLWLTIPFVQIILYPFTVAGGTLLNLERLQQRKLY